MITDAQPTASLGSMGSPVPSKIYPIGGRDSSGILQAIFVDSAGMIYVKVANDPATQTTLAAILAKLSGDPATQTTLAAVLGKLSSTLAVAGSVTARSDAQIQARAGSMAYATSGNVALVALASSNVLMIANPIGSGKNLYLAAVSGLASTGTIMRIRGATIAGTPATVATNFAGITGATVKAGGTISGGTTEAILYAGQSDSAQSGTVRIAPGESLCWQVSASVAGSASVNVQAWSE